MPTYAPSWEQTSPSPPPLHMGGGDFDTQGEWGSRSSCSPGGVGAATEKLKKVNKKRTVTVRRLIIFFEYLKASIADLFTMLSSSVQNSEGRGDGNSSDSFFGVSSGLPLV